MACPVDADDTGERMKWASLLPLVLVRVQSCFGDACDDDDGRVDCDDVDDDEEAVATDASRTSTMSMKTTRTCAPELVA